MRKDGFTVCANNYINCLRQEGRYATAHVMRMHFALSPYFVEQNVCHSVWLLVRTWSGIAVIWCPAAWSWTRFPPICECYVAYTIRE